MNFYESIASGKVKKITINNSLIKSIYHTTLQDLSYLKKQKIDRFSARKCVSNYYDCLRSIIDAIALLEGYKIYDHETYAFFLEMKNEKKAAYLFDKFRRIRNKINYYGLSLSIEEAQETIITIRKLTTYLINTYLERKNAIQ